MHMTGNAQSRKKPIIVQYDNELNVVHANTEALEFTGKSTQEAVNHSCSEFWGHPSDERCQQCPLRIFQENDEFSTSLVQLQDGGNWWKISISELYDQTNTRTGFLAEYTEFSGANSTQKPLDQLLEHQFLVQPVPEFIVDFHSGFIVIANIAFQELLGINSENITKYSVYETEQFKTFITNEVVSAIRKYGYTDGHLVKFDETVYSLSGQLINLENMNLVSFRLKDVTENESLKLLVSRLNNRFLSTFENTKTMVWEYDIQNNRFYILDYYQQSGHPVYELDTTSAELFLDEGVDPEDYLPVYQTVVSLTGENSEIDITYRYTNPLTAEKEIHQMQGHVIERADDGTPVTAQGTISNISELYFLKEERSRASILYNHLFQQSPVMIMRIRHSDGVIMDANQAMLRFCGKSLEDIHGKHPTEIGIWPESRETWAQLSGVYDRDLMLKDIQVPLLDKDGKLHQVILSISYGVWNDIPSSLAIGLDITEEHQLQQELIKTQQRMQNALDAINEGYFDLNLLNNHMFANDNCLKILGYEPQEFSFSFSNWITTVHRKDRRRVVESFRDMVLGRINEDSFRIRMLSKNDDLVWILQRHKTVEFDEDGNPARIVGTITDMTQQIQVEQELKHQKETLEATFNAIDEGIWEYNLVNQTYTLNERCEELLGLNRLVLTPELLNTELSEHLHPDDKIKFFDLFSQHISGKIPFFHCEIRLRDIGSQWKWFNVRGAVIERDTNNQPIRMVGALAEITERKEIEKMMRLSQAGVEQTAMMAFLFRHDASIMYVNEQACSEMGYTKEEFYKLKVFDLDPDFITAENREMLWEHNTSRIAKELTYDLEVTFIRKDGSTFPATLSFRIVDFEDEKYYWALAINTSNIKAMEDNLRQEQESLANRVEERTKELTATTNFLDLILQALPMPIYIKNSKLEYVEVNKAFCDYFGLTREEIIGNTIYTYSSKERGDIVQKDDLAILHTNQQVISQESMLNKDDELRETFIIRKAFTNPRTGEDGIVGTFLDITDRVTLQKQLEETNEELQRAMQVKDEFLANMSHELRTPLTSVIGYSELLLAGMGGKLHKNQEKYVNHIHFAGEHLLSLITDILDYSKFNAEVSHLNLATVRVRSICIAALSIMEPRAFKKDIQMEFDFDDAITNLYCDQQRLRQILINLMNNAIKFSDNYGTIGLRVKQLIGPTPIVEFQVWDNGIGIDPEDQSRIFEPFTQVASDLNRNYEGSGIGLALVKKFVELHDGKIWVESEVNSGSIFYIQIPVKEEPQDSPVILLD